MVKSGTFTANGSSAWLSVKTHPVHIAINGTFGSGTVAVEQRIQNTTSTVVDSGSGDSIRLTLSGSTSPDLDYKISGVVA
jgi:hypothetical protein